MQTLNETLVELGEHVKQLARNKVTAHYYVETFEHQNIMSFYILVSSHFKQNFAIILG